MPRLVGESVGTLEGLTTDVGTILTRSYPKNMLRLVRQSVGTLEGLIINVGTILARC